MYASQRPLTLRALAEAVGFGEMHSNEWDQEKIVNREYSLIEDCYHLLSTRNVQLGPGADFVQQPIPSHSSVYDFLASDPSQYPSTLPQFHIYPVSDASIDITKTCIQFFKTIPICYNPGSSAVGHNLRPVIGHHLYDYARFGWADHMVSSGETTSLLTDMF